MEGKEGRPGRQGGGLLLRVFVPPVAQLGAVACQPAPLRQPVGELDARLREARAGWGERWCQHMPAWCVEGRAAAVAWRTSAPQMTASTLCGAAALRSSCAVASIDSPSSTWAWYRRPFACSGTMLRRSFVTTADQTATTA